MAANVYNSASRSWASSTGYVYDGEGRRVQKLTCSPGANACIAANATSATTYVYDAEGNLVAEYGSPSSDAGTMYLAADHLGSTRMMTGPQSTAYHDYLPFGEEIPSGAGGRGILYGETDDPRQKFTGKERDAETGLDWFGTRYLSSAQGRFTSPDKPFADQHPEDPQSWNLYGYVRNNPLRMVDDDGEGAKEVLSGIWQGAKNAYNGTMAGFIGLATQTDKAVAGTWSDFKEGVQLLSSSEGRQSIAEGWSSLSDQDKAAFVTEVAIGVVATVASHGE